MNLVSEKYAFIQFMTNYSMKYEDEFSSHQERLNDQLSKFLKETRPSEYRIINAQVVFFQATETLGAYTSPAVQHILHIAYKD